MRVYVRLALLLALAGVVLVAGGGANASPGGTARVSLSSAGGQGTGDSGAWGRPAVSAGGRYVAFESFAAKLVSGDTNNASDIFVRDRETVSTTRVSVATGGGQASGFSFQPAISSNGRYVAFESDAPDLVLVDGNGYGDVFVSDGLTATTVRVSVDSAGDEAEGSSYHPSISAEGRYVAFSSDAPDLVSGDGNSAEDIFIHDRDTDGDGVFDEAGSISTTRVSVDSGGNEGHGASSDVAISGDGRYVAFCSAATDLVDGDSNDFCDMDGDTEYDDNCPDVFVRDRQAGTTERVSVDSNGDEGDGASSAVAISGDGRFVSFYSQAPDLVFEDGNGYGDIFVHDRQTGATTRVSVSSAGEQAEGGSSTAPGVSPDGRYVAFYSRASNLVLGDTNGRQDVFLHDRLAAVGGIAELPDVASGSGRAEINFALLAAFTAAAAVLALIAGVWYAGRRFRQG